MTDLANLTDPKTLPHYTGEGDQGQTQLGAAGEIAKHDFRLTAYGECEAANAAVGHAIAMGGFSVEVNAMLASVQHDLFDLASDLTAPQSGASDASVTMVEGHVERLERAIDFYCQDLPEADGYVLPGGTIAASLLYRARTDVRRAERALWIAQQQHQGAVNPVTGRYLNRLSSLLYVLGRVANAEHGDSVWDPGSSLRPAPAPEPEEAQE